MLTDPQLKQMPRNTLNELDPKDWIKFTKSYFVDKAPTREDRKILHPASFPEAIVAGFIQFFTKRGQWVLDPFAGTGSTIVAAKSLERNSIGIELYRKYASIAKERLSKLKYPENEAIVVQKSAFNLATILKENNIPALDFCITSPPYWNQLRNNSERQQRRVKNGLMTYYGTKEKHDLGLIKGYEEFLESQMKIFNIVYDHMKNRGYLVVITNNVYRDGRLYPLAFDTLTSLSEKWIPKDEKIWCQDYRKLFPFGMFHSYIGNRSHHYCLVFRKEI